MDLYIVQVDGLDVSFTYSQEAALDHGRRLSSEDPALKVRILRVRDGSFEAFPDSFLAAEAATA
jgi:hypothetical protein